MPGMVAPMWDVARSSTPCRYILETARQHGLDPETCLSGTGLAPQDLAEPATEIHASQELAMIRNVIGQLGDQPGLGMETGSRYNFADIGILGYALISSPTVGDAIDVACRYGALTMPYMSLAAPEVDSTEAVVAFDDAQVPPDVRRFLLERDFAMFLQILPPLMRGIHAPTTLRLEVADLQLPARLVEIENLTVTVENTTRNALIIPAELVAQPMPAPDPQTAAICIRQCEELLNRRRARRGISASIRMRMIQDSTQIPSMTTIAKELCITERTLHRRLAAEGTSYRALLDEVRATLAAELLNSGLTVEETARRLGYSETAAFTRAHTRWNGRPPSRRKRQRNSAERRPADREPPGHDAQLRIDDGV
ncbi:transcriptional regulator [Mycobacterium lentiflavum]|uniref:Transcriptional regulator n=1 Tax=Mycobacterium lentiflavum TaxID=141349 RepID=A0A0E3WE87_MYCLN|nr:AraC family transcriptional regulator [Mycobacterium lentiflavum]CQD24086.1 transcriptional regulator [Mycobacterium lentiflavum]